MNLRVKIKRLHDAAVIPQYAREGDAGFDLVACEDVIVEPGQTVKVPTGLAFELPPGTELQVRPRSGITLRTKLRVALGTCDSSYRGEVGVIVDNVSRDTWSNMARLLDNSYAQETRNRVTPGTYLIRKGDRIAQAIIAPVEQAVFADVDELSESERGDKGFGSSGVKANG
jgi:dUTP pyrophosphatase